MPFILIVGYLFVEVMITTAVASEIGGVWMFAEVLGTAALGILMLTGLRQHVVSLAGDLMSRRLNESEVVASSIFRLLGAFLLILPGVVTDALGLALQVPFLGKRLLGRIYRPKTRPNPRNEGDSHGEIIDVEVVDSRTTLRKRP
ncbi:MAG: FxsA family protein [Campylobacterales bacterium]